MLDVPDIWGFIFIIIIFIFFFLGYISWLAGSQFPDQELNPGQQQWKSHQGIPPGNLLGFIFLSFFFFLMWTILKVFIEFVTILPLLFVFWLFGQEAYGILAPQPGIKPTPHALEGEVPTIDCQGSPLLY